MDSDTSLQDIEDELLEKHKVLVIPKRVSEPNRPEPTQGSNKISLQGTKWSPVPKLTGPISGIPTIAIRVQSKQPDSSPKTPVVPLRQVAKPAPVQRVINGNSVVIAGKIARPQPGVDPVIPPIIVFPNSTTSTPVNQPPPQPVVKSERLETHNKKPSPRVIKITKSESNDQNRAEFVKSTEACSRNVNLTLNRFIGPPCKEPPSKQAKMDYTICSACRKVVPSDRLALHVALDHGSSPAQIAAQQQQQDLQQPPIVDTSKIEAKPVVEGDVIGSEHDYGTAAVEFRCCPLCKRRVSKDRFNAHVQLVHSRQTTNDASSKNMARNPFECLICSARFRLRPTLIRHQQFCGSSDPDAKSHMCEICGACFYDQRFLQSHMTRAHTSHFDCEECGESFPLKRVLQEHKLAKHRKRAPRGCGKTRRRNVAKNESELNISNNLTGDNGGDSEPEEEDVGRDEEIRPSSSTSSKQEAEIPLSRSYTSVQEQVPIPPPPPLVAETPVVAADKNNDESTPQTSETKRRRRSTKPRPEGSVGPPYLCRICGKKNKTASDLSDHEDMHNGIKRHKCDQCGKAYTFKSAFWVHQQKHENKDLGAQFGCDICFELFKTKQSLTRHKIVKHPESVVESLEESEQLPCQFCQKLLKSQAALRMHILRGHPEVASSSRPIQTNQVEEDDDDDERDEDDVALEIDEEEHDDDNESDVEMEAVEAATTDQDNNNNFASTSPLIPHTVSALSESEPMPMMCQDAHESPLLICPDDENVMNELCLV